MEPITRKEKYLAKAAGEYSGNVPAPVTREEMYLNKIAQGGSGGTSDYTDLDNKPSINGEELSGNMTAAQLGLAGLDSSGKVPMNQLPPAAIERITVVEDDTARFTLTTDRVQNGDTVKVTETDKMYMVVDDTNLDTEAGYSVYVAGRAAEAVADEDGNNIKESLASKVDKVPNKSLSTNDYTDDDKDMLNFAVNNGVKNLTPLTYAAKGSSNWITGSGNTDIPFEYPAGDYIFSCNTNLNNPGGRNAQMQILATDGSIISVPAFDTISDVKFTFTLSKAGKSYGIYCASTGAIFSNMMIRPAYITDDTFEPYAEPNYKLTQKMNKALEQTGYNLLEIKAESQTVNGVTFTVDKAAGTITANGTATNNAFITVDENGFNNERISYRLSGCPSNGGSKKYAIYAAKRNYAFYDYGNGETVEIKDTSTEYDKFWIMCIIYAGQTVSNLVFKPMLRHAELEGVPFQPYAMSNAELTQRLLALEAAINN